MALSPWEQQYLKRLQSSWASKESMAELLKKRREKEKSQQPWILSKIAQTGQNIGAGAIQAWWELAVWLPWQLSRLAPWDQSADQSSFFNKTQRLLQGTKQSMAQEGVETEWTWFGFGKWVMNIAAWATLSGGAGSLLWKLWLQTATPTTLAGKTLMSAGRWLREWLWFDLASWEAPWAWTVAWTAIWAVIPWAGVLAGALWKTIGKTTGYLSKITPKINTSKVGSYTESAAKWVYGTAKDIVKSVVAPYTQKIDEVPWIVSAIKPKQVVRNGIVTRSQEQINNEIKLANDLIRKSGAKPKSIAEYNTAIKSQMQEIGKQIEAKTKQKLYINLTSTSSKLKELANSPALARLDPQGAKELKNMAARMRTKQGFLKVEDAEFMNQFINDELKNIASASETRKKWLQIIVWDLRDKLDETLSNIPWEFKDIKKTYWALRNVYRDGISREIVYNRANPEWLISSYSKIEWASDFMSGLMKIAGLNVKWWVADIAKWLTKNKLGQVIKTKNDPNYIINKIFNDTPTPVTNPMGSNSATVNSAIGSKAKVKPSLPLSSKSEVKYSKKDIASKKYNPTEIYKDYTENYMHSDKWRWKSKSIVIDSDNIKKMMAEYDPKNPWLVHEESSKLSKEFFDRAVAENPDAPVIFSAGWPASGKSEGIINGYHGSKNVIFDTVLGDFEAFLKKAKSKIKDWKVKVHAIYTDINTAKKYNAGRDRSVPESLLESKHKWFRKAMDDLINSKEYKEWKIAVEIRANKWGSTEEIPTNQIEDFIREHKNRLDIK